MYFKYKDRNKNKKLKKSVNTNQKKGGCINNIVDFEQKLLPRIRDTSQRQKGQLIPQEDVTILNARAPNKRSLNIHGTKADGTARRDRRIRIIVRDVNIPPFLNN